MNKQKIASELLFLAKELIGIDFQTQDAMDKYLKDHPDADRTNHKVVKTKKDEPAKKDESDKKESPSSKEPAKNNDNLNSLLDKKYGKGKRVDTKLFGDKKKLSDLLWKGSSGKDDLDVLMKVMNRGAEVPEGLLDDAITDASSLPGAEKVHDALIRIRDNHKTSKG